MAVHTLRYEHQGRVSWGVVRSGSITPIPGEFATTRDFVRAADVATLAALTGPTLDETEVRVLAPITQDAQFVCQGLNYRQHMIESGIDPDAKTFNLFFTKAPSCIAPARTDIVRPSFVTLLDYELELGLVVKRDITSGVTVTASNLLDVIAGVVIVNDVSARDIQVPQGQFYKGKSYRTFGPVGPYLCLLAPGDEPVLRSLQLTLTVNGEVRQSDNTKNLVWGPEESLTELTALQDLNAGDLIATGTPAGCALRSPSPTKQAVGSLLPEKTKWQLFIKGQLDSGRYLRDGDVLEARIRTADGSVDLGVQRNVVVPERR